MTRLDPDLLKKMARKMSKSEQYIREQISRRASRNLVSSLAAQLLWARELGFGVTSVLNRADSTVRDEVRSTPLMAPNFENRPGRSASGPARKKNQDNLGAATINFLLEDSQLKERCRDLLLAKKHYDRVLREATTVLDDRLKESIRYS